MKRKLRSPIDYYGAKNGIAPFLISHFPKHSTYIEAFCGSAAVLMNKSKSEREIIADIDPQLVNFFLHVRDDPIALHAACQNDGRAFYRYAKKRLPYTSDPLQSARMYFTINKQAHKQIARTTTWDDLKSENRMRIGLARIIPASRRLQGVHILCCNYAEIMLLNDSPDTFAYLDPPYPNYTRGRREKAYFHEMGTVAEHVKLLRFIRQRKMKIMISSYCNPPIGNPLYDDLLKGWRTATTPSIRKIGHANFRDATLEKIWKNY